MKNKICLFMFITLTIFAISSCNTKHKFDSSKWKQNGLDWWMTDVREKMVEDLIKSDTLIGMNKEQIIALLGQPETSTDSEMNYLIREKYETDIDPVYISNLIANFGNDGLIKSAKIRK